MTVLAVRREKVILDLDDNLTPGLLRAAAAAELLKKELNGLSGHATRSRTVDKDMDAIGASATKAARGVDDLGRAVKRVDAPMATGSRRMRMFADIAATLGPALVPIGALAVPAVIGLANELGVAALAGGTAITAFNGVGDALKAMSGARANPSIKSIEAAKEAMEKLSPAAQALVVQLSELKPALTGLRDSAASGMFPGLIEGIDALESRLPDLNKILGNIGSTLGDMLAEGGASLASSRWDKFFDYLATDATTTLTDLGRTVGSLTHGMAELFMAMDPLSDDFTGWLADISKGFDEWAQGLSKTEGFHEFVEYIRAEGPKVANATREIGDALLQIAEAAAPLGGPTLQALEAVSRIIGTIADSNLGTPLLALASLNALAGRMAPAMTKLSAGFAVMSSESGKAGSGIAMMRRGLMGMAAPAAGLGIAMSGLGQNTEYANTAMFGAAGLMLGPWAGAAGAAAGLTLDIASANDDLEHALKRTSRAFKGNDYSRITDEVAALSNEYHKYLDGLNRPGDADVDNIFEAMGLGVKNMATDPVATIKGISDAFTDESKKMGKAVHEAIELSNSMGVATSKLAKAMSPDLVDPKSWGAMAGLEDRLAALQRAQPAMAKLGITLEQLGKAGGVERFNLITQIANEVDRLDSAEGRIEGVKDAIEGLGSGLESTADKAAAFSDALDALLDPQFNLSAATDEWHAGLQHLNKELSENGRAIVGQTDVARENREVIRDRVSDFKDILSAEAAAGAGTEKLTKMLKGQRQALIDAGVAAGLNKEQLTGYLNQLGLTPKLVRTIVEAVGVDKAKGGIKGLIGDMGDLDGKRAHPKADLDDKAAKAGIAGVIGQMNGLDKKTANPKVTADTSQATAALGGVVGLLSRIRSKSVNVNVTRTGVSGLVAGADGMTVPRVEHFANGGTPGMTVPGQRAPYGDKVLAFLAPGEEVISNRNGQADRHRALLKAINANHFADGGTIQALASGGTAGGGGINTDILLSPLQRLKRALRESTEELEREKDERSKLRQQRKSVVSGVRDRFRSDLFGESDPWDEMGGAAGVLGNLRGDTKSARAFNRDVKALKNKGIRGNLLATLLDQGSDTDIDQLAAMSKAELAKIQKAFRTRQRVTASVGRAAGDAAFAAALRSQNKELQHARRQREVTNRRLTRLEKAIDRSAKSTGKEINKAGSTGKRNQRR